MNENKTIRFSYDEDTMDNHKMFIWVGGAILIVSYLICGYFWGYKASTFPYAFFLIYLMYLWNRRWQGKNEEKEKEIALELMKGHIEEDVVRLYGENVSISSIGYYFFRDDNDNRRQCILAYLSNNKTILYDVKHLPTEEENVCCCEIDLIVKETEDRRMVRNISPHIRPFLYLSPRSEFKARILIIYLLGFAVFIVGIIATQYFKWIPLVCVLGYIVIMGILAHLCKLIKLKCLNRFFEKRLFRVLNILYYTVPAFYLAAVLLFSFVLSFGIPAAILLFFDKYTDIELTKSVLYFVLLVMTAIILVHQNNYVQKFIVGFMLKHNLDERIENYPFLEVALNLTKGRNLNYLIYLSYFLFLTWTTISRLQGFDPWFSKEFVDGATSAFLVHIAYTNMILRQKDVDLKMDTMMKFMSKAYNIRVLQFKLNEYEKESKRKDGESNA